MKDKSKKNPKDGQPVAVQSTEENEEPKNELTPFGEFCALMDESPLAHDEGADRVMDVRERNMRLLLDSLTMFHVERLRLSNYNLLLDGTDDAGVPHTVCYDGLPERSQQYVYDTIIATAK